MSIPEIPCSESIAGNLYCKVTNWRNDHQFPTEKVYKQILSEAAYVGIVILGALETLAKAVAALFLKGISYLLPEDEKKPFTKKYLAPAGQNFLMNASMLGTAALSLRDNIVGSEKTLSAEQTTQITQAEKNKQTRASATAPISDEQVETNIAQAKAAAVAKIPDVDGMELNKKVLKFYFDTFPGPLEALGFPNPNKA